MLRIRGHSITQKLTRMNMLVSAAALLLACLAFGAYDVSTFRQAIVHNLSIQAQIAGSNSVSALLFNDPHEAEETLSALKAAPNILSAHIYTADGLPFAAYSRDRGGEAATLPPIPTGQTEAHWFKNGQIVLVHSIIFQAKPTGSVYIQSDLREINDRLKRGAGIAAIVLLTSLLAALLVSSIFQRAVAEPITHLARIAGLVSRDKDYSVRATPTGGRDELAALVETFNEMLARIQERDGALREVHNELEQRIQERTAALAEANEQLRSEITQRKKSEEHLVETVGELKRSNDELEQFAYVASHDLQEPLRMVASYTQLLAKRYKGRLDPDADEFIAYAVDGSNRMQGLIQDLLAYSRAGAIGEALREISSEKALKEALTNLRGTIEESGAVVTHDALPVITTGDTQLAQIFQNLVGNAIKYHGPEVPHVHVSATKNGGKEWIFSVRDNGMGIDPQHFERIFILFQRLHGRTEFKGTGIGLAICKKILERLGGRIWVESQPEKGSTFYFALPERDGK
jgi:signal transduction histidine kinase